MLYQLMMYLIFDSILDFVTSVVFLLFPLSVNDHTSIKKI